MTRVLICGSREWSSRLSMENLIASFPAGTVVIHGAARGADRLAGELATAHGLPVEAYPADWTTHGRAAGPIRNQRMLDEGKPDEVWCFTPDITVSRGTRDMYYRAIKAGISTHLVTE